MISGRSSAAADARAAVVAAAVVEHAHAVELLEALREWIDSDVKAKAEGRDKFMAAVAMNALGMLIREAAIPVKAQVKKEHDHKSAQLRTITDIMARKRESGA